MKDYLFSLFAVSLAVTLVMILAPGEEHSGTHKHLRLLGGLVTLCVLIAPIQKGIEALSDIAEGNWQLPEITAPDTDYREDVKEALDDASRAYFKDLLTQALEQEFSVPRGELECIVRWNENTPADVTVVLLGSAIWMDPSPIEAYVEELLNCPCNSAIKRKE